MKNPLKLNSKSFDRMDQLALALCLFAFLFFYWLACFKYEHLGYYDWDLAFNSQAAWNLLHGSSFTSLAGINYFGDHSYYILIFLLPFFALVSHPLTLVFFAVLSCVLAGWLLYRFARPILGAGEAFLILLTYLIVPANIFSLLYEFNVETLTPALLVLLYIYFEKEDFKKFCLTAFFVLLVKENFSLVLAAFGILGLFSKKEKIKWGVGPLVIGVGLFVLLTKIIIPLSLGQKSHAFVRRYTHMGGSLGEILGYFFVHPLKVIGMIFDLRNLQFLWALGGSLIFLFPFYPPVLLLSAPLLLQHLLSNSWQEHTIFYHYGAGLVPFIVIAFIKVLQYLKPKLKERQILWLTLFLFLTMLLHSLSFKDELIARTGIANSDLTGKWKLIQAVPKDAKVVSTFEFLTPLSLREHLYSFHVYYDEAFFDTEKQKRNTLLRNDSIAPVDDLEYALIDFNDLWLRNRLDRYPDKIFPRLEQFFAKGWTIVASAGDSVLFKKGNRLEKVDLNVFLPHPLPNK